MAAETNVMVRILVLLELDGWCVAGAPARALDDNLEHVSAHHSPPREGERMTDGGRGYSKPRRTGRGKRSGDHSHLQGACPCRMFPNSENGCGDECGSGSHV